MSRQSVGFGIAASWISRLITISAGVILLPVLFRGMGKEELGIWFLLGQSGAFLGLMDIGLTPTLTRRIALAKGRSGGNPDALLTEQSRGEIADLLVCGRAMFRWLALSAFVIAWMTGVFFLWQIELPETSARSVWLAWTILCAGHAIGVWGGVWACLLNGMGYVGRDALINTAVGILVLSAQIVVVLAGGGLVGLAIVGVAGGLTTRWVLIVAARSVHEVIGEGQWDTRLVRSMASPAIRAWITLFGGFLILKTDQYFIAVFRSPTEIPSYHAAYQILANLQALAGAFATASAVFISQLWQAGETEQVHRLVLRSLRAGLIVMVCGVAFTLVAGQDLFGIWLGPGNFVGTPVLAVLALTLVLEVNHGIVAISSRATEDEAFALWALASGGLNLLFTWWLVGRLGLLGVALGTCLAQLLTNNWYAVHRGLQRLRMSRRVYLRQVVVPVVLTFLATLGGSWAISAGGIHLGGGVWLRVAGAGAVAVTIAAVAVYALVLDPEERLRIRRRMTRRLYRVKLTPVR